MAAATSTGCNTWLTISRAQLPVVCSALALTTDQRLICVLSMVVVGGLVGAGALGYDVVARFSQGKLYAKRLAAGLAIVLLGVMFDRITHLAGAGGTGVAAAGTAPGERPLPRGVVRLPRPRATRAPDPSVR